MTLLPSPPGLVVEGASQIATLAGGLRRGAAQGDAAVLQASRDDPAGLAVACWEGRVLAAGNAADVDRRIAAAGHDPREFLRIDATGCVVTPGLVDAHTHLIFGGSREAEWQLRQRGASYLDILAAGGGILSTVAATRAASDEELLAGGRRWLNAMLANGTTTVEVKSGYGLDTGNELRLLDLARRLGEQGPVRVVPTYLGAHAVPADLRDVPDGTETYVRRIVDEQLPAVAAQGVARSCDVFCELGVFTTEQARRILDAARSLGLPPRLHADELSPSGGAQLAAELGCLSADHLDAVDDEGVRRLAEAAAGDRPVVATLLPAASWFLGGRHYPPARRLVDAGVPLAIATDFNPGTGPVPNLPLAMSIACVELHLTAEEVLVAATINAARALAIDDRVGSIEPGKHADLVVWSVPAVAQIPYWAGGGLVREVVVAGAVAYSTLGFAAPKT